MAEKIDGGGGLHVELAKSVSRHGIQTLSTDYPPGGLQLTTCTILCKMNDQYTSLPLFEYICSSDHGFVYF